MTKHYNVSISQNALRILNSKQGDYLPDEVAGPVAVIPIKPVADIVKSTSRSTTGNSTIYSTPSDKDFYLTGAVLSGMCDATADVTSYSLVCTIDGVTSIALIRLQKLTTTAFNQTVTHTFPVPIKCDRGSVIAISHAFTVGSSAVAGCIQGYTVETTR